MEMQTRSNVTSNVNQEQNQTIANENKKEAAKTLLLIAVFYSICMSPLFSTLLHHSLTLAYSNQGQI